MLSAMILPSGFRFTGKQAGIYIESPGRVNLVPAQMFIDAEPQMVMSGR
jgi:hypothetical protein